MDFTKITCISERCKENNVIMKGAGGTFGSRITITRVECPVCDLTLMIIPMSPEFEYSISATTEDERKEKDIQKAIDKSELELAKKITSIRERG